MQIQSPSALGVTNERALGLPPLTASRKETWDYYQIEFLPDGYPGKRVGDDLYPHPIYGPYVITDYVAQYKRTRDPAFLEAAHRVADAAIARMTDRSGALVFEYRPGTVSSLPETFYSGLTQARYLGALGQLDAVSDRPGERADAQAAIARSFDIPAEAGGVARTTPGGGLLIEEYAHRVPDYTLNGWTTATELIYQYAAATGDEHGLDLFRRSLQGIADVLPLYDVPEFANTRYRLTGRARLKLAFSKPGAAVLSTVVTIPGQGDFPVAGSSASHWDNRYIRGRDDQTGAVEGRIAVLDALLSRVSWPAPNVIRVEVTTPEAMTLTAQIGEGDYNPLASQLRPERFTDIAQLELQTGRNTVEIKVPWVRAELVAYPTNFAKLLAGRRFNFYHFIHIDTVTKLGDFAKNDLLLYFGAKWGEYPTRWPDMPVYADGGIELVRHRASSA